MVQTALSIMLNSIMSFKDCWLPQTYMSICALLERDSPLSTSSRTSKRMQVILLFPHVGTPVGDIIHSPYWNGKHKSHALIGSGGRYAEQDMRVDEDKMNAFLNVST